VPQFYCTGKKSLESQLDTDKKGTDKPLHYRGISLKISEMKYDVISCENIPLLVSLNVYIKNFMVHSHNDHLVTAVYTILEMLLEEKSFANEIHFVSIYLFTSETEKTIELAPLSHLEAYIPPT
jgi:hypothetical protein